MQRISETLESTCRGVFAAELEWREPGDSGGRDRAKRLAVHPAIVDLDIAAPDIQAPGRQTDFTTTPARMTLRLEVVDPASGAVARRIVDHRRSEATTARQSSIVGNLAEVERILRQWAVLVREFLREPAD
jgi:hypothetical protein